MAFTEQEKFIRRWKMYKKKIGKNITKSDFIDYEAIKSKQVPPSKQNLEIFHVPTATTYSNLDSACEDIELTPFQLLQICETKTGDWIYLKDL